MELAHRPGSDPYSVTQQVVNTWKSMAFTGAVTGSLIRDYMRFTYTNN